MSRFRINRLPVSILLVAVGAAGVLGATRPASAVVTLKKPTESVAARAGATLCSCSGAGKLFDSRVLGDGSTVPFVIPNGMAFMVTGFDFGSLSVPVGQSASAFLAVESPGCMTGFNSLSQVGIVGVSGWTGSSVELSTPIRVVGELCVNMNTTSGQVPNVFGHVRGFFTKDK